ncbi:Protein HIR1 [Frankliniella fusca]|uniref:Protein HIR1 n=1 Tax=Frankliniella fusca TaxID=407009 RepID=A0AAE1LIH0_9NEOP|nr:Protein HIR1 [Frankliniella fusca]
MKRFYKGCLRRVFPFLLKNVPEDDGILQLVFLLQDIVKIIFSFEITDLNIIELENLIYRHNQVFHELFVTFNDDHNVETVDDVDDFDIEENEEDSIDQGDHGRRRIQRRRKKLKKGINKLHHLMHYPQQMREKGPMIRLWCARFEGRHRIIRKHSGVQPNFKNPPKTMARMFQLSTLGSVIFITGPRENVISGGEKQSLECTPYCAKLLQAGFLAKSQVTLAKSVEVCGEDYSVGHFVNLKDESTAIPSFAIILDVIVKSDKCDDVFLAVRKCKNNGLSRRYNSYSISNDFDKDTIIVKIANLAHHRVIAPWTPVNDNEVNLYLHPRTV